MYYIVKLEVAFNTFFHCLFFPVEEDPAYTWTQTMEDVTMTFTVPQRTQKSDINLVFTPNKICIELKNGPKLLEGPLFRDIDVSVSTWILEGRK